VIGYLSTITPDADETLLKAFRQALRETGFVEGQNVAIEYRWAENHVDRLPQLLDDLVRRRVNVIVAPDPTAALAAKPAATTIPIVFWTGTTLSKWGSSRASTGLAAISPAFTA